MGKKVTSKRQKLSWEDIQDINLDSEKIKEFKEVKPDKFFQNQAKIGAALLECLHDNDAAAFIEILDEYLRVNRTKVAKKARMGRSTIQEVFSKKGNPTLKTIAKIVHFSGRVHGAKDRRS